MSTAIPTVGAPAPDFALLDESGTLVRLSDLRGSRVLLYFYPRDDTGGCTKQACGFRDHYAEIEAEGAIVLGISPDDAASHQRFRDKYSLPFSLLVDADHAVAEAYGVWAEKSMYGRKYLGIVRSHFIVDAEGKIEDAQVKVSPAKSVDKGLRSLGIDR